MIRRIATPGTHLECGGNPDLSGATPLWLRSGTNLKSPKRRRGRRPPNCSSFIVELVWPSLSRDSADGCDLPYPPQALWPRLTDTAYRDKRLPRVASTEIKTPV